MTKTNNTLTRRIGSTIFKVNVSAATSEADSSVAHYEEAVTLIGKAWSLPAEVTQGNLSLIQ